MQWEPHVPLPYNNATPWSQPAPAPRPASPRGSQKGATVRTLSPISALLCPSPLRTRPQGRFNISPSRRPGEPRPGSQKGAAVGTFLPISPAGPYFCLPCLGTAGQPSSATLACLQGTTPAARISLGPPRLRPCMHTRPAGNGSLRNPARR